MKTWLKAILCGVAGAVIGALFGVAVMLAWFFWLSPPTFKNDSEAMAFGFILFAFGALVGGAGALLGAIIGSSIVWWRANRYKVTSALLSVGGALFAWSFDQIVVAGLLLLLTIVLIIWDLKSKTVFQDQLR